MNLRFLIGSVLAGCLILGIANSAAGQVWLEAPLLDVASDDDRYGDYEPVALGETTPEPAVEGPLLVAQSNDWVQPPGQTVAQPATPVIPRPAPAITPFPSATPSVAPPVTPYSAVTPYPPVTPYASPAPPVLLPPRGNGDDYGVTMSPTPGSSCPPWRPCGPQDSFGRNWLFPQKFFGADYRPACAQHDACLMSGCTSRKACDRMFLANMDCACNHSLFPNLCRLEARKCYLGVRLFGWMF